MRSAVLRRLAGRALAGGLIAVGTLTVTGTAPAVAGTECYSGQPGAVTIDVDQEASSTATAVVTVSDTAGGEQVDGAGALTVSPGTSYQVDIEDGAGTQAFPVSSGTTYEISFSFGSSADGCVVGGTATESFTAGDVAGVEGAAGGDGGGEVAGAQGNNRSGTGSVLGADASAGSSGLGATGSDLSTQLLMLLGVGLVGAGAASIAMNRRRAHTSS